MSRSTLVPRRWKRASAAISISIAVTAILAGCTVETPSDGPPRWGTEISSAFSVNSLSPDRRAEIAEQQCPATVTSKALRALPEPAANAVDFFAASAQCGFIDSVLHASAHPDAFASPLQYTSPCTAPAIVSVWAHYDDDLIFGSPTIPNALNSGQCVRTLFLTGSDAGMGRDYAMQREIGIREAYNVMRGTRSEWIDIAVTLRSGVAVTLTAPADDPNILLIFVRLPDGGLGAGGFGATGNQALPQLLSGEAAELTTTDTGQAIGLDALSATIAEVVHAFTPQAMLAHLPKADPRSQGDHPDHSATGTLVARLADAGIIDGSVVDYAIGYPSESLAQNISGAELQIKLEAFAAYASHDSVLHCSTAQSCLHVRRFGAWLQRQYLVHDSEIPAG